MESIVNGCKYVVDVVAGHRQVAQLVETAKQSRRGGPRSEHNSQTHSRNHHAGTLQSWKITRSFASPDISGILLLLLHGWQVSSCMWRWCIVA